MCGAADQPEPDGQAAAGFSGPDFQERFVWPPRPLPEEASDLEPAGQFDPDADSGSRIAFFPVWNRVLADRLSTVETRWLGRIDSGSWARRCAEMGLEPEDGRRVCPRCAGSVGIGVVDADGCGTCRVLRLGWSRAVRLGPYAGELREAVHDLKYRGWRGIGESLGAELGRRVAGELAQRGIGASEAVLVPVPTRRWRRLRINSGVDHTLALARGARRGSGVRVVRALARRRGPRQTGLSATARAANARRLFRAVEGRMLSGARAVILIDDVRTTGATATACGRLLAGMLQHSGGEDVALTRRDAGDRVWLATVAVAGERRRRLGSGHEA